MGYSGWHGVTDHLHILIAVSYEPVSGDLACRFNSGADWIYYEVPEQKYQILIRSPYAGSYFRKHIKEKFRCECLSPAPKSMVPLSDAPEKKLAAMAAKRLSETPQMEHTLFGPVPIQEKCQPKRKKNSTSI